MKEALPPKINLIMNEKISNYESIIEHWISDFVETMKYKNPDVGDRSGDQPLGVKIMFDGYGFNEKTNENDDLDILTFANSCNFAMSIVKVPFISHYWQNNAKC